VKFSATIAPGAPQVPYGSVENIPNLRGIMIPFVPDLAIEDNKTVPDFIDRYLIKSLSADLNDSMMIAKEIRSAWGVVSSTVHGMVYAHLVKCLDLALRSGAIVYPIITNHTFEGCSILGDFRMYDGKEYFVPVDRAIMLANYDETRSHAGALGKIAEILGVTVASLTTMRTISAEIKAKNLTKAASDNVKRFAVHLSFPEKYWGLSDNTVLQATELIADASIALPLDMPMHPSVLTSDDRYELVLSAFGYMAPSFVIKNCPLIKMMAPKNEVPQHFLYDTKVLSAAVADWKSMRQHRTFTNNPKEVGKAFTGRRITLLKNEIWVELRKACHCTDTQTTSKPTPVAATRHNSLLDF